MTIYTITEAFNRPTIKMTGKWLERMGFKGGDKLEAVVENNMIVLIKISLEEIKEIKEISKQL